ncbi:MAG TPA: NIPSNAP family protein [Pedobacter sp.]|uniref:NIPSNAP family protein n=1 Tax=Pedobacter sp. TaxID=1411316 RepID=UPI002B8B4AA8|nr:NIPSNAP family protein [Pedobacter sp.]HMI05851.1 NIPSNAP family protein [Pedobacter sp.]
MSKKVLLLFSLLLVVLVPQVSKAAAKLDFYQIKIYHLKTAEQENRVDQFLKDAYLPALHRAGISSVGVFKPIVDAGKATEEKLIYVLIPFASRDDFFKLDAKLSKDQKYHQDGTGYLDAKHNEPPYSRMETILLNAFEKNPKFGLPNLSAAKKDRVYELRSYEGPTEKISANKIRMFNSGDEVGLFKRLGFNAVFYAQVVAGSSMPNLMYMTTFENRADRDKHWDAFGKDDYWRKLSAMPEYQNNVSKGNTWFLYPADYSDI